MENQELLNPESDKTKKDKGAENLNPQQESTAETPTTMPEEKTTEPTPDVELSLSAEKDKATEESLQTVADSVTPVEAKEEPKSDVESATSDVVQEKEPLVSETAETDEAKKDQPDSEKEGVIMESKADVESASDVVLEKAPSGSKKGALVEGKEIHLDSEEDLAEDEDDDTDDSEAEDLAAKYGNLGKEELVEAIEVLVKNEGIAQIRKHIGYLKVAFRNYLKEHSVNEYENSVNTEEGTEDHKSEAKPVDELQERFNKAFAVYKEKKHVFDQAVEKQKQVNLETKETILEELRVLIDSEEELKKTYDQFKELQETWRKIGPVPQTAKNTLWNNYHFLVEKFFDKVKINKELRDLDLKKNLESKTELCEKAEELLLESSINKSFQKLQKLHDAWKETGPVPKDKKDEIWDRFKAASDSINERRQSYYDLLREEQSKNYAAKILLCEQAEQLAEFMTDSPKKWQDATDKVNELFKLWKTVGFAPKKINDEVWVRFRTALDGFFNNKKEFFFKYKDDQTENYNQKLNLCLQAEALKDSEDWKHTTDELIALQQQWKKIGPVPKKFSDKVWKRFRTACDEFFNRKSEYFSNIGDKQDENLQKKKELIEKVKTFQYSADNTENLNTLKDFQRQWMEIGHVPIKEKDKLQNEFRKVVNDLFENLNINRKVKSTAVFKNKIENLKNSPNAENVIYKEKTYLISKINVLQNDIKLWENNIGFFASSKKADVLKLEFEQKIERAKADIAIMEQKLKILNAS
jgi:hypothetical protein